MTLSAAPPSSSPPPSDETRLHRALSRSDAIAVAVGSVVGVGIFRTTGQVYRAAGGALSAMLVWLVLGALSLVGAYVYADLATRVPEAGGPYAYVRVGFGRFAGFVDGWFAVIVGNPARQATGFALIGELLARMLGVAAPRALSVAAVVALAALNWIGVKAGARSQKVFTGVKLAALIGLIALALWPHPATGSTAEASHALPPLPFLFALTGAWYAYLGWEDVALLAEELRSPKRDLLVVFVGSVSIVVAFYLLVNAAILYAADGGPLAGAELPALEIAHRVLGQRADQAMSGFMLVSMVGAAAEGLMVRPRFAFALARDGFAPQLLTRVNRGGTPTGALALHAFLVIALLLSGSFQHILSLFVFAQAVQSFFESAAYFTIRRRIPAPQLTPLHPVLPALFVSANATLAVWVAWQEPESVLYALLALAIAMGAYRGRALFTRGRLTAPAAPQ
ncbi:MAG TPA: APC family permease [Polyangiaceae bacterium]|nr:APC family permease [Polyangiaceae bacterium]